MDSPLRRVKLPSGHTLAIWDDAQVSPAWPHKNMLRYTLLDPAGNVVFGGSDYGTSPMHSIDGDACLLSLLGFLTLRKGDTDSEYFEDYTPVQLEWSASSACESLACDVSVAEEAGGCACGYVWENLDGWTCDDDERGNVAAFEVLDHGEDGSQYFPGCGVAFSRGPDGLPFETCVTGVGDTATEALDDALEQMAQNDARPSKLQESIMRSYLRNPDASAHAELEAHDCEKDGCDWSHWVSIRYNVRKEGE